MFEFLMVPSNAVCNRLGLTDAHERGMMRMLINMMIITAIASVVAFIAWRIIA
jgi:hypothetical protein